MTPTDNQLKQALAKMLPDKLPYHDEDLGNPEEDKPSFYWVGHYYPIAEEVLDTELLHLCWLVEEGLRVNDKADYEHLLSYQTGFVFSYHATWQQRVIALAKVKGVEVV